MKEELEQLETKIDLLLSKTRDQASQLDALHAAEAALNEEKALLVQKNKLAKSKIEAMLSRLKNLEQA